MKPTSTLEQIANRVFASWKTSVVAGLIVSVVIYLGVSGAYEWDALFGWMATGGVFLFVRDGSVVEREKDKAVEQALKDPKRAEALLEKRRRG